MGFEILPVTLNAPGLPNPEPGVRVHEIAGELQFIRRRGQDAKTS
jgi:hypothetical protein